MQTSKALIIIGHMYTDYRSRLVKDCSKDCFDKQGSQRSSTKYLLGGTSVLSINHHNSIGELALRQLRCLNFEPKCPDYKQIETK